jgi:hypothetical protein
MRSTCEDLVETAQGKKSPGTYRRSAKDDIRMDLKRKRHEIWCALNSAHSKYDL